MGRRQALRSHFRGCHMLLHMDDFMFFASIERKLAFSRYNWGAVLNETSEAHGFWYDGDRELHITYKELKAVRLTTANIWIDRMSREIDFRDWKST
eukprot:jgi/Tetstr1/432219/TSEL_021675.t1